MLVGRPDQNALGVPHVAEALHVFVLDHFVDEGGGDGAASSSADSPSRGGSPLPPRPLAHRSRRRRPSPGCVSANRRLSARSSASSGVAASLGSSVVAYTTPIGKGLAASLSPAVTRASAAAASVIGSRAQNSSR